VPLVARLLLVDRFASIFALRKAAFSSDGVGILSGCWDATLICSVRPGFTGSPTLDAYNFEFSDAKDVDCCRHRSCVTYQGRITKYRRFLKVVQTIPSFCSGLVVPIVVGILLKSVLCIMAKDGMSVRPRCHVLGFFQRVPFPLITESQRWQPLVFALIGRAIAKAKSVCLQH
jgi:hypothetical protein